MTNAYLAMLMKKEIAINVMGIEKTLPFDFADGLIGMMPVFDSAKNARKYAGDDREIMIVAVKEATND